MCMWNGFGPTDLKNSDVIKQAGLKWFNSYDKLLARFHKIWIVVERIVKAINFINGV